MFKIISVALLSALLLAAAGCQSKGDTPRAAALRSPDSAVMCDECKTTWVRTQKLSDKGIPIPFQYTSRRATVCPECAEAAQGYFAGGALAACKTCGGSMHVVEPAKQ
jgi:hypothetical protein